MEKLNNYLVPEYYPRFLCKGPACRTACCGGWGISVSMKEYFSILSLACSDELSRKRDCAFHVLSDAREDRYAQITPNWLGDCPMHLDNGLCGLQCECGEENIPAVCRLYPRGAHNAFYWECSMSNSCEAVLELLFAMEEPLRFEWRELPIEPGEQAVPEDDVRVRHYRTVRDLTIGALQDRSRPLPERIRRVGRMLAELSGPFMDEDDGRIQRAIEKCGRLLDSSQAVRDDESFVRVMQRMCAAFSETSASIEEYARHAAGLIKLADSAGEAEIREAAVRYRTAAQRFEAAYPEWERMFEQMMVNHVCFEQFPFADVQENLAEKYTALCAAYAFVRFLAVCWTDGKADEESLIDVCAAAFRLIDHSRFGWNASVILRKSGLKNPEEIDGLLTS